MNIFLIILIILIALSILGGIVATMYVAYRVYDYQLVRPSGDGWGRGICSFPDDEEQVRMFNSGMAWAKREEAAIREVQITNDGLKLCGQFFDFGFKRCVILMPGRTEACTYSYYFAQPYKDLGYNVLVIDNRAHGLSDGKYNCVGLKEYKDILAWTRYAHDTLGNEKILLFGVCIGSAGALSAITDESCPDYVEGIITDGTYTTFYETFKNHMIALDKPVFPVCLEVMLYLAIHAHKNPVTFGPVKVLPKLHKPILMLYGKKDVFSLPEKSKMLFASCPSEKKRLVWFEKGGHSHLRINAEEEYDAAIGAFVHEMFD